MGSFLVTIDSKKKLKDVIDSVQNLNRWDVWIGLNRLNEKDAYLWDSKVEKDPLKSKISYCDFDFIISIPRLVPLTPPV